MKRIILLVFILCSIAYSQFKPFDWFGKSGNIATPVVPGFHFQVVASTSPYSLTSGMFDIKGIIGKIITIDWGDGTDTTLTMTAGTQNLLKTYTTAGTYDCVATGDYNDITYIATYAVNLGTTSISQLPDNLNRMTIGAGAGGNLTGSIDSLPSTVDYFTLTDNLAIDYNGITGNVNGIPSTLTVFKLYCCNNVAGTINSLPSGLIDFGLAYSTINRTVTGSLDSLPSTLTSLRMFSCMGITGTINKLPSGLTYLYLLDDSTITGSIDSLPSGLVDMHLTDLASLRGDLNSLSKSFVYMYIVCSRNQYTVTGDIGSVAGSSLYYYSLQGWYGNALTYTQGFDWTGKTALYFKTLDISKGTIDTILCDIDTSGVTNGSIDIRWNSGGAPSALGLAAKANLIAKGWSVLTN